MKSLSQVVMEQELLKQIKCLLCKCPYGYHKEADKKETKPELLLQDYLKDGLKKNYEVTKNYPIDVDKLPISPTIYETKWEIDLGINKDDVHCFVEVKYDEEYIDGGVRKTTNTLSEDEILRDAYKLQCVKKKYKNVLALIIFATNKASHWKEFTSIPSGQQTINYNGQEEKFRLLKSHDISWNEAMDSRYKYCIVRID